MMYEFEWLMKICLKKYVGSRQSVSVALRVMFPQEKTSAAGRDVPPMMRDVLATMHRSPLRVAIADGRAMVCRC